MKKKHIIDAVDAQVAGLDYTVCDELKGIIDIAPLVCPYQEMFAEELNSSIEDAETGT